MAEYYPTLKTISTTIDPETQTEFTFTNPKPYFLIDLQAPEVETVKLAPIARANQTCYERAINKYFAGGFQFDIKKQTPVEPRTIKFLDSLNGVFAEGGKYLLNIVILEWE